MKKRKKCTKEAPYTKEEAKKYYWSHPDAYSVGGCYEGCCDDYRCPYCKEEFRVEHPD